MSEARSERESSEGLSSEKGRFHGGRRLRGVGGRIPSIVRCIKAAYGTAQVSYGVPDVGDPRSAIGQILALTNLPMSIELFVLSIS